jgi:uncharacterized metal-binding protein
MRVRGLYAQCAMQALELIAEVSLRILALDACAQSAALAHLGQSQVHQLCLTVQKHDVVGLEVAMSVSAKLLQIF